MPSTLLCHTNAMLQASNNLFATFPIHWNSSRKRWILHPNKKLISRYNRLSCFCDIAYLVLVLTQFIMANNQKNILVLTFFALVVFYALLMNLFIYIFPNDILLILNMTRIIEEDDWYVITKRDWIRRIVNSENNKIAKIIYSDSSGFATLFSFVGFTALLIGTFFVQVLLDLNFWLSLFVSLGYENFVSSLYGTVILSSILFCHYSILLMSARIILHLFILISITLLQAVKILIGVKLSYSSVRFYRLIQTGIHSAWEFAVIFYSFWLTFIFVSAVYVCNMTIVGLLLADPPIIAVGVLLGLALFPSMYINFYFGCHIFKSAVKIKRKWMNQIVQLNKQERKYMRRVVQSVLLLSVPCGSVGIYDNLIEMNYYDSIISYVTNVLVILKDRFSL